MNIACAFRWGVALVGGIPYWAWLTFYGNTLTGTGSILVDDNAVIVKKADMWP